MSKSTNGNDGNEPEEMDAMNVMSDDLMLLDEYLANELSPAARAKFEERLRTDKAFQDFAMPFIDGVTAWRDPMRMPIDERDAAENGPTHEELLASEEAREIEPALDRFADKVGIPRGWWKPEVAEEMDAVFQRRFNVRLMKDAPEALPVREEVDDEEDDPKILHFPHWRRLLMGGGLVAAGVVGTLADLKIQAAMHHKEAVEQNRLDELRLGVVSRNHSSQQGTPRAPQPFQTSDGGIRGTVVDGTLDLSYVGSAQDSAVFATLSAPGQVNVDIGPKSRGMVISTPSAQIELLEPGSYTIAEQSDSVGYVTVASGLARVDDRTLTSHGVQTARSGETIKTRKGRMPTRNMKE